LKTNNEHAERIGSIAGFLSVTTRCGMSRATQIRWYAAGIDIEDRKRAEERTRNENVALREEIDNSSMFEEIVGSSESLRRVLAHVAKVAPMDSTVLILGETGTGKELIARALYNAQIARHGHLSASTVRRFRSR
jgi:transcriptional regulator with PAS, ATPase and Fis domain